MTNSIGAPAPPQPQLTHQPEPARPSRLAHLLEILADVFRRGWDVVEQLLSQIWERSQKNPHVADAEQLALFESLRDEGLPEHLDKFRLEVTLETQSNTWGYAFFIRDAEIARTSGVEAGDGAMFYAYQSVALKWEQGTVPAKMPSDAVGVVAEVQQDVDNLGATTAQHKAGAETIRAMRGEMADYVKALAQREPVALEYFNDALKSKFNDIAPEDVFWQDENPRKRRSDYDFRLKTEVFPGQDKAAVLDYLAGRKSYTPDQESKLIDLFVVEDKVHAYLELAQLFLHEKGLDPESVSFADNHFYIPGKDKTFIPNDGNCFFHCLDYLTRQQQSSGPDSAPQGPVVDLLV